MGAIIDTLQILERVMEYKKACRDILLAAARSEVGYKSDALRSLAAGHDEDVKQIPLLFKGLTFGHRPPSDDDVPLTEIRPALFQDVGKGGKLNLLGAAIRVEKEAIRLLDNPLQKTGSEDLRSYLRKVIGTARRNISLLEGIDPDKTEI